MSQTRKIMVSGRCPTTLFTEVPVDVAVTYTFVVSGVDLSGADDGIGWRSLIVETAKQYVADNKHALDEPTNIEILS